MAHPHPLAHSDNLVLRWYHRGTLLAATYLSHVMAAGAITLGLVVLVGWEFQIDAIKRLLPQFVAMNPLTALAFILSGGALGMLALDGLIGAAGKKTANALAIVVGALGGLKLIGYLGGLNLGLDEILFHGQLDGGGPVIAGASALPNRMAPNTAFLFMLIGVALLASQARNKWVRRSAKLVAALTALQAVIAAIGYFNGVSSLYQPTALIPIALHTVLGFVMLSAGILGLDLRTRAAGDSPGATEEGSGLRLNLALERKITVGFGAALFLLAVIGVVSYASIASFAAAGRLNAKGHEVTLSIADFFGLMRDAETGVRGYVISGEDSFLEPYRQSTADAAAKLSRLQALASDNPDQHHQLVVLVPLVGQYLGSLQQLIDLRRNESTTGAAQMAAADQSKEFMDRIRGVLSTMRANEDRLREVRSREIDSSNGVTSAVISSGSILAFLVVCLSGWVIRHDLREKRRMDAELRKAEAAALEANESKSRFLANMSHEIRTPMAAIIGYADLILDANQSQSDRLDYINTIRRNGEHLLTIINDVLDLSKIEANKLQIERVDCCPCQILSDVASLMRVRAVEKLIRLEVKNEGLVPATVRTDSARLRQILINLVGNAIKFTEEGWVRLIMRLEESPTAAPRLRFDIIDTGIGMDREQIGHLFQPFVQADGSTTRKFGGTGLGLSISKRLAELLGGKIEVDSSPGRGSTFTLTIDPGPLEGVQRMKNCREALAGIVPSHADPKDVGQLHGRVLLVDDGLDNRRLLSVYLREAGAEVALAENGRLGSDEALAAAANGAPYDVILMDMQMPELDGYGAAARLRSKEYTGPIVALTAHAMAEDRDKCIKAGCTDYLSKPVRRDHLLQMVARYLPKADDVPEKAAGPAASAPSAAGVPAAFSSNPGPQKIRSDLTDQTLRSFLNTYVEELPGRISELQSSLAQRDLSQLSTKVHNLRGTGGLYGLMPITHAAASVENLIHDKASIDAIAAEVGSLIAIIERVEGFDGSRPRGVPGEAAKGGAAAKDGSGTGA